jgi:hypothetical protein
MKYILLVHHNEQVLGELSDTELQALRQESVALANKINANGQYVDAAPLRPTSTATCVRVREGKRLVTDGPFAETREQLGGYFLINAENLDDAIAIAGQIRGRGSVRSRFVSYRAGGLAGESCLIQRPERLQTQHKGNDMKKSPHSCGTKTTRKKP